MKKSLIVLLFFCTNVFANKWIKATDVEDPIYVDVKGIKKNSEFVFYTSLSDTPLMGVNSVIVKNKVDCKKKKVIELNVAYYGQPMGKGPPVKEENNLKKEVFPKPLTTKYKVMKFACDNFR